MDKFLKKYNTSHQGLSESEVLKRQQEYGLNELDEKKPTPLLILFLSQFVDALIALLIIAAIASIAIGDFIDAGVISGIDMTPETTYVKLCWALGQSDSYDEVKEIMHENIAGEFSEKSSIKDFLN